MRIALLADVHLSHRRYAAVTKDGRNQREADVSAAWFAAVAGIETAHPDLILIGGDLFDRPRVSNLAMRDAVEGCIRLRKVAPILSVLGNHDSMNTEEGGVGSPQHVLTKLNVKVVAGADYVRIPSLNTTVLCVAERYLRRVMLAPNQDGGTQLLLAHGAIGGRLAAFTDVLSPDAISPEFRFSFLGDYHVAQEIRRDAWYPGSLEFVSSDPWSEIGQALKGWLLWEEGVVTHHPVPTRPHFDLPRIDALDVPGKEVTERILANIAAIEPAGAVVRQVVVDCHRATKSAIDFRAIKEATAPMLAWRADVRRPDDGKYAIVADLLSMKDGSEGPDWIDEMNRDVPLPQRDDYSYADTIAAGGMPKLDPNADPYGLDAPKARARSAA